MVPTMMFAKGLEIPMCCAGGACRMGAVWVRASKVLWQVKTCVVSNLLLKGCLTPSSSKGWRLVGGSWLPPQ